MKTGRPPVHGMTNSPAWRSWQSMMTRCYNSSIAGYKYWGGRGITVCDEWHTFMNFFRDMGERPEGTSLDRINNDGNYEPGNCRWATNQQQGANTRSSRIIEWQGESHCITEWARILNVRPNILFCRIRNGWSIEDVMTKGYRARRSGYVHHGTLKTHCKRGHPLSGDNLRINPAGQRSCVRCNLDLGKIRFAKRREAARGA